jgi:hypothetical protein
MSTLIERMDAAADALIGSKVGYDQGQRWSYLNLDTKQIIKNKECDCSSACGGIAYIAGAKIKVGPDYTFYTGNFKDVMVKAGWTAIKCTNWKEARHGEFLLGPGHVVYMRSDTRMLSAENDERGKASGGKAGAQVNDEVYYRNGYARSKGWTHRLVPPKEAGGSAPKPGKSVTQLAQEVLDGKYGNGDERKKALGSQYAAVQKEVNKLLNGDLDIKWPAGSPTLYLEKYQGKVDKRVRQLQQGLEKAGYSVGPSGDDGQFGTDTKAGLRKAQKAAGVKDDGQYGKNSEKAFNAKW